MGIDEKKLREDFSLYRDPDGMIQNVANPNKNQSGNGLLYSSEYYIILCKLGLKKSSDQNEFLDILDKCMVGPGLFRRAPEHYDQQGPDDYVGVLTALHLLGLRSIAETILIAGQRDSVKLWGPFKLKYFYNTTAPGSAYNKQTGKVNWSAWLGRQPQLIAHLYFASGLVPPLWRRIWWATTIMTSGMTNVKDQDARIMSWMLIQAAEGKSWICDQAIKSWRKRFYKDYPNGLRTVLGDYFGNHNHPISKYWVD